MMTEAQELEAEIARLRAAMAKAGQRAAGWPDSNDDPAQVLADVVNILYAALSHRPGQAGARIREEGE